MRLYSRTLGGLCLIAEQVEKAIGLIPLPDVNDDAKENESESNSR